MEEYECISCTETQFGRPSTVARPTTIDGVNTFVHDKVCGDCLIHIFDEAVQHESNFPPKWGETVLDPERYRDVLSAQYMQRYAQRKEEWSHAALDRVYCNARLQGAAAECGNFLGARAGARMLAQCTKCQRFTCKHCRELVPVGRNANHYCDPNIERQDVARAFEGLRRGKDYQKCPRCDQQHLLADGCNHVQCTHPCLAWFCFSCGAECDETYSHFSMFPGDGKCETYPAVNEPVIEQEGGRRVIRPVVINNPGLVADLQGVFGQGGNVGADLRQQQEELMRGFGGGNGAGRQFGQAFAPWRDNAPQLEPLNHFPALEAGGQNQANHEDGDRLALVPFAGALQGQAGGQRQEPAAADGAVPLEDRLTDLLTRLSMISNRVLAIAEFECDDREHDFLVKARQLHAGVQVHCENAQRAAGYHQAEYNWAVQQYEALNNLTFEDNEWQQAMYIARTPPLWSQWIAENFQDRRMARVTAVAGAERPGGLFEQVPNAGAIMMGLDVGRHPGQDRAGAFGDQPEDVFHPYRPNFLGQQAGDLPFQPNGLDGRYMSLAGGWGRRHR